jgi:UDP-glucuronate 4-epimerase
MIILITGDAGFVGKHLITNLSKTSDKIHGYDLQRGEDILNMYKLWSTFDKVRPDIVIHLAAKPGVRGSNKFAEEYIRTNIAGTKNIVDVCHEFGVKKLIFFSSSSVYGNCTPPAMESSNKKPISMYGVTKLAGEQIVQISKVPSVTVRPFTIYGENGREESVLWKWKNNILAARPIDVYGDGKSCRGYVYIQDVVSVISELIQMPWTWEKEDFNVGGDEIIFLDDIISIFQEIFPLTKINRLPLPEEDIYQQYADISKAKGMLRFNPQKKFKEIVKKTMMENN